eukprot:TRINITY_DN11934_c0_g1_i1.p1 TRINITY_DN11934_c0_g1~~TRINITY_DN11934_c0_g1_i1.p1  ORF type:complete len:210 (-),score=44.84 TRINITY_DN11934_c0_g1_i1:65-694(-)
MSDEQQWNFEVNSKDWEDILIRCLHLLATKQPNEQSGLFISHLRPTLPDSFGGQGKKVYCFAYKGKFLPSGNLDGRYWKPSQGTKEKNSVCKRYFYSKDLDGNKMKRQVMWLKDNPDWNIVEYSIGRLSTVNSEILDFPKEMRMLDLIRISTSPEYQKQEEERANITQWNEFVAQSDKEEMDRFPLHFVKDDTGFGDFSESDPFNSTVS